jgi:PPOX class probable F420-dependent enzyme
MIAVNTAHLVELADRHVVVMATVNPDGRPQLSLVRPHVTADGIDITLTDQRVKTRNLRHDPRVALLAAAPDDERFVVVNGHAELSDISRQPGDETGQRLADMYRHLAGEHPDWDDYYQAMVNDRRLIAHITPTNTYHGGTHT